MIFIWRIYMWHIFLSPYIIFLQELHGVSGEWEVPGPTVGLQAGPRQAAQREGAPQAAGEWAGQWERGIWSRDPVLTSDWLQAKRKKSESAVRKCDMEYYAAAIKSERSRSVQYSTVQCNMVQYTTVYSVEHWKSISISWNNWAMEMGKCPCKIWIPWYTFASRGNIQLRKYFMLDKIRIFDLNNVSCHHPGQDACVGWVRMGCSASSSIQSQSPN